MSDLAIRVENLSKLYRIGKREPYLTLRDTLAEAAGAPIRRLQSAFQRDGSQPANGEDTIWALKDVSFEVRQGEVVGVIGRNGAGKSTVLKILSRITKPTRGFAEIHGRVGSLLEVGTGFHPELTGRENIYLNGAILGMGRREIERKFDEIVEFAEIEKFLDTPVKRYSSGMYVRLAFAVAAHLEPEILLVDEVLAVGDAAFQKKCLGKMEVVVQEGRTILFVSHNMLSIQSLCQRVLLLENGQVSMDDKAFNVVSAYLKNGVTSTHISEWSNLEDAPGNRSGRIKKIEIECDNQNLPILKRTDSFDICVEYWLLKDFQPLGITLRITNEESIIVFATSTGQDPKSPRNRNSKAGLYRSRVTIPANLLNSGNYHIDLLIVGGIEGNYNYPGIISFEVQDVSTEIKTWYGRPMGVIHPILDWKTEQVHTNS